MHITNICKIFGTRAIYDPVSIQMSSKWPISYDIEDEDTLAINKAMTIGRRDAIELENARRRRQKRIKLAVKTRLRANNGQTGNIGAGSAP